jgi:HK97 family phage major capsid protein
VRWTLTAGSGAAHVVVTTAGQVGAVDIRAAWSAIPERYRATSSWVMNRQVAQAVAAAASPGAPNALALGDYFVLPTGQKLLCGRPVYEVDDAPALLGNTAGTSAFLVVGDFGRGYCAPQRSFTVELIPSVPNFPANNLPTGTRAWLATARFGGGVIIPAALRVLANA